MRGPSLAIVLSTLIGCSATALEPEPVALDTPATPPDGSPLPEPKAPAIAATGALGERVLPVKLPSAKSGETAAAFRFGRENERGGWVAQLPERSALVTVAYGGGKIFVGGGFGASTMYALDAKTGKKLWTVYNTADPGPTAAVYDNGELAFNTFSCSVEVLDAETGKQLWTKWIGSETPNQPAMAGNLVLATHPTDSGSFALSAYKRKNGADVWSSSIDGHILGAPIVSGESVYVATTAGTLYRIGLDGKRAWRQQVHATSAPWVDGDELHLSVREGREEAQVVLSAADGKRVRTALSLKLPADTASDAVSAWSYEGPRPVVRDGIRFAAMGSQVEARDAKTNEVKWTREKPKGEVHSVVVVGPLAIFTTKQGELVALDRESGAQRLAFDFKVAINAQPIVAEGWMYLATGDGRVLALELGNPATMDGWHMWGGNAQHNL